MAYFHPKKFGGLFDFVYFCDVLLTINIKICQRLQDFMELS